MASSGLLIRFIDVGLIVLFGFVMISDIENSTHIELSRPADGPETDVVPDEQTYVAVRIAPDGTFAIVDPALDATLVPNIAGGDALEGSLRRLKEEYDSMSREMIVLIEPHWDSIVQRTVDVMDACDRLGLRKSLQAGFGDLGATGEA